MRALRLLNAAEQVAAHLQEEVRQQTWSGKIPGVKALALELGVNPKTVKAALALLVRDGVLVGQGARRRHQIHPSEILHSKQKLRVAILVGDPPDKSVAYMVELQHLLMEAGHSAFFCSQSLLALGMNVGRVARMVEQSEVDAWVVCAASGEVLEWFAGRPVPVFALFGRRRGLPIAGAGPDKPPALAAATRALIALGHRRIVLLSRTERRLPEPGASERAFLDELARHGIAHGPYHLPDWEESVEGFQARLESLFRFTPPSALIIDEMPQFIAVQQFVAGLGLRVPGDVSLVCTDADPAFAWCVPTISQIRWDSGPVVRRIVRWAANVKRGKADLRQTFTPAEFVPGGTIGPAKDG
jgi:hypothetical protein